LGKSPILSNRERVTNITGANKKEDAITVGEIVEQPGKRAYTSCEGTVCVTERKIDQYDRRRDSRLIAIPILDSSNSTVNQVYKKPVVRRSFVSVTVGTHHGTDQHRPRDGAIRTIQIAVDDQG